MSLGRIPLVEWMQKNNHLYSIYYYENGRNSFVGKYFYFTLCWSSVALKLKELNTPALKRSAIAEIDKESGQNPFHYVFSNKLPNALLVEADYFVLRTDYDNRIINATRRYVEDYAKVHDSLIKEEKLIPICSEKGKTFPKDNLTATVGLLLDPFKNTSEENHNPALVEVFSQKDTRGNTPLFYEYRKPDSELNNVALYDRIAELDPKDRAQFLSAQNEAEKTLLHEVVLHWAPTGFPTQINRFGGNAVKSALRQPDEKGNTPIHYLFLKRNAADALSFVILICELIKQPKPVEQKKPALEQKQESDSTDYLPVNLEGQNPLHVLSQSAVSEENLKIFQALLDIIPEKLKSKKIMQLDRAGFTPVHYAIASGNFNLALGMISKLRPAEQLKLILMKHNPKKEENLLHYICRFGNNDLLRVVVEILGPAELHRVRSEMPLKLKEYGKNPHLCQNERDKTFKNYSKLFDIFDYLVRTFRPDEKDFKDRFGDFCVCYAAIQAGEELPDMSLNFYAKKHGVLFTWTGSDTYHQLRFCLSVGDGVSPTELGSFATWLSLNANDGVPEETTGATQPKQKASDVAMVAEKILDRVKEIENKDKVFPALECKTSEPPPPSYAASSAPPQSSGQASMPKAGLGMRRPGT